MLTSKFLILAFVSFASLARAAAPQLKTQSPGWFRIMVGDFEITALSDGYLPLEPKLILRAQPGQVQRGMKNNFIQSEYIPTSVNAFLINTGTKLVMVDTGAAKLFGPTMGNLMESLKASGYRAEQVDLVLLTHLHGDHANGLLTAEGQRAFPNATVMATKPEADFWLDKERATKAPKEMQPFFQMAQTDVEPYVTAKKWQTFEANAEVSPGIRAVATSHTPGHTSYMVSSKGQNILFTGDVLHVGAVQFEDPGVSLAYDVDDKLAIASRKKLFAEVAQNRTLMAFAHVAFPGLGHLRKDGKGYVWVPLQYLPVN